MLHISNKNINNYFPTGLSCNKSKFYCLDFPVSINFFLIYTPLINGKGITGSYLPSRLSPQKSLPCRMNLSSTLISLSLGLKI